MISWIKTLLACVRDYKKVQKKIKDLDSNFTSMSASMSDTLDEIRQRTTVHADLGCTKNSPCTIILIGQYRGGDYIKIQRVDNKYFDTQIAMLKDYTKHYGVRGCIDAPRNMSTFIDHELPKEVKTL